MNPHNVTFTLRFPDDQAIYDDLVLSVDDNPLPIADANGEAYGVPMVQSLAMTRFNVSYRLQGLENSTYNFGNQVTQVKDFQLRSTAYFGGFDFPEGTLSPSEKHAIPAGWELAWNYKNLISGYKIGLAMPQKFHPGPLAGRPSYFAPVLPPSSSFCLFSQPFGALNSTP